MQILIEKMEAWEARAILPLPAHASASQAPTSSISTLLATFGRNESSESPSSSFYSLKTKEEVTEAAAATPEDVSIVRAWATSPGIVGEPRIVTCVVRGTIGW